MLDLSGEGIKIHVPNKTASNLRKAEKAEKKRWKFRWTKVVLLSDTSRNTLRHYRKYAEYENFFVTNFRKISEMVEMMEGVMGRALGFGSLRGLNEKLNNVLKFLFFDEIQEMNSRIRLQYAEQETDWILLRIIFWPNPRNELAHRKSMLSKKLTHSFSLLMGEKIRKHYSKVIKINLT